MLKSSPNSSALARWGKAAFTLFLYFILYGFFSLKRPGNVIPFFIILAFLLTYFQFTLQKRFWQWEFYDQYLIRKNLLGFKRQKVNYRDISSWQIRERFGSESGKEYIPNYTEIAFWIKHKEGLSFDEIDYSNYQIMADFFISKMAALQIEAAPYHE